MSEPNLNGPEAVPLREIVKSYMVDILIMDKDFKLIRLETIDYGKREHRAWLGKVTYWACTSGYTVQTKEHKA